VNTVRLGDVSEKIGSGATPRGGDATYIDSGVALIRSQNVYNDRFAYEGLAHIDDIAAERLAGVTVAEGDVLLNITGDSVARVCLAPADVLPARVNQHVSIIRPKSDVLDPRFLRYYLVSPGMQRQMLGLASAGATRKALTKAMIQDFSVPCPPIETQRSIADVLAALDAKIDLNRRRATNFERVAKAIFRSRFVYFDNARELVDSPLGPIPQGWGHGTLGQIAERLSGSTNPIARPEETFELFSIPAFDADHRPEVVLGATILSSKTVLTEPAVLVSKLNPETRRVWDVRPSLGDRSVCSGEFVPLVRRDNVSLSYIHSIALFDDGFWDHLLAHTTGTTGSRQRVRPAEMLDAPIVISTSSWSPRFSIGFISFSGRASRWRASGTASYRS
jgi:type I restriction enzyme S subunit